MRLTSKIVQLATQAYEQNLIIITVMFHFYIGVKILYLSE